MERRANNHSGAEPNDAVRHDRRPQHRDRIPDAPQTIRLLSFPLPADFGENVKADEPATEVAMMDLSQQKAQFSIADFHAVATVCGLKLYRCDVDDESIDITVGRTGGDGSLRSPRLDVQLKCSGRELLKPDGLHFQMKRKNYEDLRATGCHIPRILVVLLVPDNPADWCVNVAEKEMCLRHNAWWMNLTGAEEKAEIEKPTVVLPRAQLFHPTTLVEIMDRVGRRELQ